MQLNTRSVKTSHFADKPSDEDRAWGPGFGRGFGNG